MARRFRAVEMLKQMKPPAVRRFALAVFLMFGIMGPLTILMESRIRILPWSFIFIQTFVSGAIAASVILVMRKRWWVITLVVIFWSLVMTMNSGGVSFIFDNGKFTVRLGTSTGVGSPQEKPTEQLVLQPSELDAIYAQRGVIGIIAIALLTSGYVMFIRVIRGEVQQRERLETEVRIARDIQQSLLPSGTFTTSWCSVAGKTIPASEVGGDYYDIVSLSEQRVALAIADVTGHGVGAGILSAMTKSAFHAQLEHDPSPVGVLTNLNKTIYEVSDEKMFVTFAYVLVDSSTRSVELATAGHPPILVRRETTGTVEQYRTISLGLGIQRSAQYSHTTLLFEPGDMILLYTDGVVEAISAKGDQFGADRLLNIVSASRGSPAETCEEITQALTKFAGKEIFEDDVSLLCIKLS